MNLRTNTSSVDVFVSTKNKSARSNCSQISNSEDCSSIPSFFSFPSKPSYNLKRIIKCSGLVIFSTSSALTFRFLHSLIFKFL